MHSMYPYSSGKIAAARGAPVPGALSMKATACVCENLYRCGDDNLFVDAVNVRVERHLGTICCCLRHPAWVFTAPTEAVSGWGTFECGCFKCLRVCSTMALYTGDAGGISGEFCILPGRGDDFMRTMSTNKALIAGREVMISVGNPSPLNDPRGLVKTYSRPMACIESAVVVQANGLLTASMWQCYPGPFCCFKRVKTATFLHDVPYVAMHELGCCQTQSCCYNWCKEAAILEIPGPGGRAVYIQLTPSDAHAIMQVVEQRMTIGTHPSVIQPVRTLVSEDRLCCGTLGSASISPDVVKLHHTNLRNCMTTPLTSCFGTDTHVVFRTADVASADFRSGQCIKPSTKFVEPPRGGSIIDVLINCVIAFALGILSMFTMLLACSCCCKPIVCLISAMFNAVRTLMRICCPPYMLTLNAPSPYRFIEFYETRPEQHVSKLSSDIATLIRIARERTRIRAARDWAELPSGADRYGVPIGLGPGKEEVVYAAEAPLPVVIGPATVIMMPTPALSMAPGATAPPVEFVVKSPLHAV